MKNNKKKSCLPEHQELAVLIKDWGLSKVDELNLKDYLKFKGVSLWDIVAPSQAIFVLPKLIFQKQDKKRFSQFYQWKIKPYLKQLRSNLREFKEKRNSEKKVREITPLEKENTTKIIFLSFEPRQIKAFIPVMNLLKGNQIKIKIIGSKYRPAKNKYKVFNSEYIEIEDFFTKEVCKKVKRDRKLLKEKWQSLQKNKFFKDGLSYQGIPLWSQVKDCFFGLFIHTFPQLIKQIEIANLILDKESPDIVIGADDWDERARTYFLAAKKRKIPTLHIQYGLAGSKTTWEFMSTDKAAIFSKKTYQTLTKMGVEEKSLVITGSPRFDRLIKGKSTKNKICRKFKVNPNHQLVLFASQPNVADCFPSEKAREELIATIYNVISQFPKTRLIVKPHPDEDVNLHDHLKSKFKSTIIINKNFDIFDLVLACDALVSFHSTTALEALIANKPVVLFKVPERPNPSRYFGEAPILEAGSRNEFISILKSVLNNPSFAHNLETERRQFINKQDNMDGRSSERVRDLILSMIKN